MTLNGHFALCFKIHAFSELTTKISMKIDPYYQQQKCGAMTVVADNIRFMRIFVGCLGDEASNDGGVIENVDFQAFRTARCMYCTVFGTLENEANIIVLFSPLSPFH